MIDHLKLTVSDIARSRAFYEAALAPLGYRVLMEPERGAIGLGADRPDFWLEQDAASAVTTAHVAFRVDDRVLVDAFHAAAVAAGGTDNGGPGPRPRYHPGYYGAFVRDPDGHNVEAVCHQIPPQA